MSRPRAAPLPPPLPPLLRLLLLLLAPALAAVTVGCGLRAEDSARALTPSEGPALEQPARADPATGGRRERLFLVREGELVPVARSAEVLSPQAALTDLLAGPTPMELARGLTTALPANAGADLVRVERGVAVVALQGDLTGSGRSDQVLALGQIVSTLDASPGVRAVRFEQAGEPLPVPGSDGALTQVPVSASDYGSLLDRGDRD